MAKTLHYFRATDPQNKRTILWDPDNRHPDGELFISANGKVTPGARTPYVNKVIENGQLAVLDPDEGARLYAAQQNTAPTEAASEEPSAAPLAANPDAESASASDASASATEPADASDEPTDETPAAVETKASTEQAEGETNTETQGEPKPEVSDREALPTGPTIMSGDLAPEPAPAAPRRPARPRPV